ncbi:MAG: DUF4349 domain-containing protein [Bacteroidota bacterium]
MVGCSKGGHENSDADKAGESKPQELRMYPPEIKADEEVIAGSPVSGSGSKSAADTVSLKQMPVKTGYIRFRVKDVSRGNAEIEKIISEYKGMLLYRKLESETTPANTIKISEDSVMIVSSVSPKATLTVNIPSAKLPEFYNRIAAIAIQVEESELEITDNSLEYFANRLNTASNNEYASRMGRLKPRQSTEEEIHEQVNANIENKISAMQTEKDVNFSTVRLFMSQRPFALKETEVDANIAGIGAPGFGKKFIGAFSSGLSLFADAVLLIANLWLFIASIIILVFAYNRYKRRRLYTNKGTV